jgi:two-component system response regulator MprA
VRVLVVEDARKLGAALVEGLEHAHYTVDLAVDGEEALAFAQTSAYDALVLDVLLPRVDGLEVCRRLRATGSRTPILMLTARDAISDRIAGLDSGADDNLVKPFAFGELLARLRALLRRDSDHKGSVLRVADLTLDPARQVICWGDQPVELTPREFRILELFLRRKGWVVSRDMLIEGVWGFEFPDSSNLVEVYVGRLRRKLAAAGAPPLIRTERGAGYRLTEPEA